MTDHLNDAKRGLPSESVPDWPMMSGNLRLPPDAPIVMEPARLGEGEFAKGIVLLFVGIVLLSAGIFGTVWFFTS